MKHRNIAVLMTALDTDAQAKTLKGIEEYGKKNNCNIAAFSWFTSALEREKHNLGEINIISLPDLSLFDGVILFANTLHLDDNRRRIEELIAPLSCPIVCVGEKIDGAYYVGTDNYTAMKNLVEHLIVDHKMKNIHFVRGVKGNRDAEARFKAYEDALNEHGIPVVLDRITQGDFYVTGGELAAKEILRSNLPLPEAIVCANDTMALTVCDILMERGYKIPEDVVVTGYDYTDEGKQHFPTMTTIRSKFNELGQATCKIILDVLDGKDVPEEISLPDEIVYGESCGCHDNNIELRKHKSFNSSEIGQRKFIHQMILMEKSIMESVGYDQWIDSIKEFIRQINPTEFYLCVNENFVENIFGLDMLEQEELSVEEKLAYSQTMNVIIAYKNGAFIKKNPIESRTGFDELFLDTERTKEYVFSPLHYLDRTFGYLVFAESTFTMENPLYISWLMYMGDAIENIRKQSLLKYAMNRLDEMYIRDSLTGVYNRFGMERFFVEIKRKYLMSRVKLQLSFVDIDNLKQINDLYGHEEGDYIINSAAKILQKKSGKNYVIRYGGDEFIVMGIVRNESEIKKFWDGISEEIEQYNSTKKRHAELSMSYGYEIFDIDAKTYLEDCISAADKKMYVDKNNKKALKD